MKFKLTEGPPHDDTSYYETAKGACSFANESLDQGCREVTITRIDEPEIESLHRAFSGVDEFNCPPRCPNQ